MSITDLHDRTGADWWEQLGLTLKPEKLVAARMLRAHQPTGFSSRDDASPGLTIGELSSLLDAEARDAAVRDRHARADRNAAERAAFAAGFVAALNAPGTSETVGAGRWAGFSQGDAAAWCWNLLQYERRGIAHPGSQLHHESLAKLRAGGLPEVFGYPERARELVTLGFTPQSYRNKRDAQNAAAAAFESSPQL